LHQDHGENVITSIVYRNIMLDLARKIL